MIRKYLILTAIVSLVGPISPALAEVPNPITEAAYAPVNLAEAELGQLLFWDPILSGNRNISCATCHHPRFASGDGVALSLGEGGIGLGPDRKPDPTNQPEQRIPRNAPALFNLGAHEFTALFHDGRIETDPKRLSGMRTPLDDDMLQGFASVLSAQTMFPVLSSDEMAGHYSENDVSAAVRRGVITGDGGAWDIIAQRVVEIETYRKSFVAVYPEIAAGRRVAFTDISNAIAAFVAFEWRSDGSRFDAHLRGAAPLTGDALAGFELFYGAAGCSFCHAGPFQTDHRYHAMGVPQIGPGKAARFENHARDTGRIGVTGQVGDAYAFRTPSLRNVLATSPYGHDGAYSDLRGFLNAHIDPANAISTYERNQVLLPELPGAQDWRALDDPAETLAIVQAITLNPVGLSEIEVAAISAFLQSLSDDTALSGRLGIPTSVPSGLQIDR